MAAKETDMKSKQAMDKLRLRLQLEGWSVPPGGEARLAAAIRAVIRDA